MSSAEYLQDWGNLVLSLLVVPLVIVHLINWTYERAMQRRRDQEANRYLANPATAHTLRPHSLFLRAFYTSNFFRRLQIRNSGYSAWPWPSIDSMIGKHIDLETLLACSAERHSLLIGIGHSAGSAVSGKVITSDIEWQRVFWALAKPARFIALVLANRPGTKWEFQRIIDNRQLSSKTIFIVPGSISGFRSIGLSRRVRKDYSHLRSELQPHGCGLPPYQKQGLILSYSYELAEFIHYPTGSFNFRYLNDLIDRAHDSTVVDGCMNNREFLRMLGPIRSKEGHYVARLVEWNEEKQRHSSYLERPLEYGSCILTTIVGGEYFPDDSGSIGSYSKFVIANPMIFSDATIGSMLRQDAEFFSMRDAIIRRAKGYIEARSRLVPSISNQGPFVIADKLDRLQERVFGVDYRELYKVAAFIESNITLFNWEEIILWKGYVERRM